MATTKGSGWFCFELSNKTVSGFLDDDSIRELKSSDYQFVKVLLPVRTVYHGASVVVEEGYPAPATWVRKSAISERYRLEYGASLDNTIALVRSYYGDGAVDALLAKKGGA